jgi:hypothetical protein
MILKKIEPTLNLEGSLTSASWELDKNEDLFSQLIVFPEVVTQIDNRSYAPGQGSYGSVDHRKRKSKTSHKMYLTSKGIYWHYLEGWKGEENFSSVSLRHIFKCNVVGSFRKILEIQIIDNKQPLGFTIDYPRWFVDSASKSKLITFTSVLDKMIRSR